MAEGKAPEEERMPSLEELVELLASFCDGAKKRDGHGFNKGDSQDGKRLAAMWKRRIPWTAEDLERAKSLVGRYAKQAAHGYYPGDRRKASRLERAIKEMTIAAVGEPSPHEVPFNYASVSPGGKRAYFVFMAWTDRYMDVVADIRAVGRLRHGARRTSVEFQKSVPMSVNGKRKRVKRWEVDLNGTTRPAILAVADRWGFAVDPGLEADPDQELDALVRNQKALYLSEGVRGGSKGLWFVFDLERRDDSFNEAMRARLPGRYECDPNDDWNWFVAVTERTVPVVRGIAEDFGFACHSAVARLLARAPGRRPAP